MNVHLLTLLRRQRAAIERAHADAFLLGFAAGASLIVLLHAVSGGAR